MPEIFAIGVHRAHEIAALTRQHRAAFGGGGEQGRGLGRDHFHVMGFAHGQIIGRAKLHHFAFGDDGAGARQDAPARCRFSVSTISWKAREKR